ncbi:MAG: glycoside hydrolase family 130 protein [Planctomycetota bacterium]
MNTKLQKNIVQRWEGNPVISIHDLPSQASDVHNAGAVKHAGEYILLLTVESLRGDCAIYRARSKDGHEFSIDREPILAPATSGPFAPYEDRGVRDARITLFDGTYYIVYLTESSYGFRLGLAQTEDFESIERIALISEPDTKNGMLFPCKFDGKFARLERPREGGNIWISYSDDLIHWGGWEVVMTPRHGYWDYDRIGPAAPPMETPCGWLLLYYGVRNLPGGPLFRLGVAFLDLENPANVLGQSNIPLLAPQERYERIGDVANLVFSCGAVFSDDRQQLEIYYGAADSCICLGTVPVEEMERMCNAAKAQGET